MRFPAFMTLVLLLTATRAPAVTPPHERAPLVEGRWSGVPENFLVTQLHTDWVWHDQLGIAEPTATIRTEMNIRVPADWELKDHKSGTASLEEVKKVPKLAGIWHLVFTQNTAQATATIEFVDAKKRVSRLEVNLASRNRHPYLLTKASCPGFTTRLDPGIAHARFLYLGVSCFQHGETVTLHFVRSPDARWIAAPFIKDPGVLAFEHSVNKPTTVEEAHVLNLKTEDSQGRRAEFGVFVTPVDAPDEDY